MLAHVWNSEDSTYKSRQLVSFLWPHLMAWGYFPGGLAVKNPPALPETRRLSFNPWVRKIHWRRKWQPTPVFLPRESHGQRSLVGFCPWGHKVQRVTEFPHQGSKSHPLQWKCRVLTSGQHWKSLFYFIFFFLRQQNMASGNWHSYRKTLGSQSIAFVSFKLGTGSPVTEPPVTHYIRFWPTRPLDALNTDPFYNCEMTDQHVLQHTKVSLRWHFTIQSKDVSLTEHWADYFFSSMNLSWSHKEGVCCVLITHLCRRILILSQHSTVYLHLPKCHS